MTFELARGGDGEETPDGRPRDPLAVPLVVVRHDRRAPSVSDSTAPRILRRRSPPSRRGREGAPADVARSSRGLDALDVPPSPHPPSRRRLRSAHADYVLEMLVVNDHARCLAYGGDAAAMHADSLDVVNAVSAHYAKLTPPIEVRISKQVDFESGDPYESSVTYAGSETSYTSLITEFNSYLVDAAGELGDQHDVAHLFSMRDFQYGLEGYAYEDVQVPYTGPGGLAAGVVCKVGSFGAISMVYKTRADGWRNRELEISSTTVTHETGHQFGMLHDGQNSGCGGYDQDGDTYLMNGYYVTPTRWSSCSQDVITRNLDAFACMAPSETAGPPPPTPPGSPPLSTNEEIEAAFVDAGEEIEEAAVVVKETGDGGLLAAVIVLFVVLVYFVALNVWQHALLNPEGCAAGCCVILVGAERFRSAQDAPRTWRRCSCFGGAAEEAPAAANRRRSRGGDDADSSGCFEEGERRERGRGGEGERTGGDGRGTDAAAASSGGRGRERGGARVTPHPPGSSPARRRRGQSILCIDEAHERRRAVGRPRRRALVARARLSRPRTPTPRRIPPRPPRRSRPRTSPSPPSSSPPRPRPRPPPPPLRRGRPRPRPPPLRRRRSRRSRTLGRLPSPPPSPPSTAASASLSALATDSACSPAKRAAASSPSFGLASNDPGPAPRSAADAGRACSVAASATAMASADGSAPRRRERVAARRGIVEGGGLRIVRVVQIVPRGLPLPGLPERHLVHGLREPRFPVRELGDCAGEVVGEALHQRLRLDDALLDGPRRFLQNAPRDLRQGLVRARELAPSLDAREDLPELLPELVPLLPGGFHLRERSREIARGLRAELLELLHRLLRVRRRALGGDGRGLHRAKRGGGEREERRAARGDGGDAREERGEDERPRADRHRHGGRGRARARGGVGGDAEDDVLPRREAARGVMSAGERRSGRRRARGAPRATPRERRARARPRRPRRRGETEATTVPETRGRVRVARTRTDGGREREARAARDARRGRARGETRERADAPAGDVRISPEARRGRGRAGEWNVAPRHRRGLPGAETADERGACRVRRDDMPVSIVQVVWKKCRKRL